MPKSGRHDSNVRPPAPHTGFTIIQNLSKLVPGSDEVVDPFPVTQVLWEILPSSNSWLESIETGVICGDSRRQVAQCAPDIGSKPELSPTQRRLGNGLAIRQRASQCSQCVRSHPFHACPVPGFWGVGRVRANPKQFVIIANDRLEMLLSVDVEPTALKCVSLSGASHIRRRSIACHLPTFTLSG